jgi:hypothetical protein
MRLGRRRLAELTVSSFARRFQGRIETGSTDTASEIGYKEQNKEKLFEKNRNQNV